MVDIIYSQNIYQNQENLERIINSINLCNTDIVIDIGAGNGVITKELIKHSNNVIAYELDSQYFEILKDRFKENEQLVLINDDFLLSSLPAKEFKIFANIPFSLTSEIISKITSPNSKLVEAYLFVQKESAERYIGKPINTQISTILSYLYELDIIEIFDKWDFNPIPNIEIVLLRIKKKEREEKEFLFYRDFVTYVFNQRNSNVIDTFKKLFTNNQLHFIKGYLLKNRFVKPSDIPSKYYLEIFNYFKGNGINYINRVKGYYAKHIEQHVKRERVNRTRI